MKKTAQKYTFQKWHFRLSLKWSSTVAKTERNRDSGQIGENTRIIIFMRMICFTFAVFHYFEHIFPRYFFLHCFRLFLCFFCVCVPIDLFALALFFLFIHLAVIHMVIVCYLRNSIISAPFMNYTLINAWANKLKDDKLFLNYSNGNLVIHTHTHWRKKSCTVFLFCSLHKFRWLCIKTID